ncbi:MAG: phosphatase PAP2 family protein [Candidatus Methylacidiphilales bacterium]|nr:phosphatase PAP2 family protein [Candidatus Methylacidiphilales bacterium]
MIDWLWQLDVGLARLINDTWSNPAFDAVLYTMADFKRLMLPLIIILGAIAVWGRFRGRLFLVTMLLALVLGDAGTNWTFKRNVNRPRPNESVDNLRIYSDGEWQRSKARPVEKGRSFTSGHACNNMALAVAGTAVFGLSAAWWLWPWAIVMGYSRIYTADHFPSDILGSWVVAIIYTLLIMRGMQWAWDYWAPSRFPELYRAHPRLFLWGSPETPPASTSKSENACIPSDSPYPAHRDV